MNDKDFLKLLILLPNLVELHSFANDYATNTEEQLLHIEAPDDIVQLPVLKKFTGEGSRSLLSKLLCPCLEKFHYFCFYETDASQFIRRHSKIKDIRLTPDAELFLDHLKLTNLCLENPSKISICSTIENQKDLKSLSLNGYFPVTDQLLRKIIRLQNLESLEILSMEEEEEEPLAEVAEILIEELSDMPRLKSLGITISNDSTIRSLVKDKTVRSNHSFWNQRVGGWDQSIIMIYQSISFKPWLQIFQI